MSFVCQTVAIEAQIIYSPIEAKEKLLDCLGYLDISGRSPRQFAHKENGVDHIRIDSREFIDQGLWIIDAFYQYLAYTHARQGAVPILLFGNGGCSDTSIGYERMLTEIASHGYVVVAVGEMQDKRNDRPERHRRQKTSPARSKNAVSARWVFRSG